METRDVVIVGGGPAGLAAAVELYKKGIRNVLIVEREKTMGGILRQCIHDGFGLTRFKTTLSGPEYAQRFIDEVEELGIPYITDATVLEVAEDRTVTAATRRGLKVWRAKSVILTMGCRERTRGALGIPGERPAGVFTAGVAQAYINLYNVMPAKEVVILGSGDIGLIMARRMTLEGAKVKVVAELMPYSGGLKRNIVQCLNDYDIPLKLSHTVIDIRGKERLTGITLAAVDEKGKPIPGTEEDYDCDTLLLSVGLIPENELSGSMGVEMNRVTSGPIVNESLETSVEGVFACGNVLHVHDLVDFVSEEAAAAGKNAARYVKDGRCSGTGQEIELSAVDGVRYTVPCTIHPDRMEETQIVRFRVGNVYKNCYIGVYFDDEQVMHRKRPVMAPGEMEEIKLQKEKLMLHPGLKKITIKVEEA